MSAKKSDSPPRLTTMADLRKHMEHIAEHYGVSDSEIPPENGTGVQPLEPGFIDTKGALPESLHELDNYLAIQKHNKNLAKALLHKSKPGPVRRRSKRLQTKRK